MAGVYMCVFSFPETRVYVIHVCLCLHLFVGGDEAEAKLHLQDKTIFDLKEQLSTMQWRFEDLKYKHEELKSQLSLKTEGVHGINKVAPTCCYEFHNCSGRETSCSIFS